MKTYLIVLPDCTSFKKHRTFFYKRGPLIQGHKTRAPAKLYVTLWLQLVVWRYFGWQHQCLSLGVMGRENPQTKRFLVQFF